MCKYHVVSSTVYLLDHQNPIILRLLNLVIFILVSTNIITILPAERQEKVVTSVLLALELVEFASRSLMNKTIKNKKIERGIKERTKVILLQKTPNYWVTSRQGSLCFWICNKNLNLLYKPIISLTQGLQM